MLLNNKIKGLLNLELYIIDNVNQFSYDITSKQSFSSAFDKGQIKYQQIKSMIKGILETIESGKEYLLPEDDFILDPNYLYINLSSYEVGLCHFAGYQEDIRIQLNNLIEFLMNKVDYTDEQAVVLIYGLYKLSKEENCTFDKLTQFLNGKKENNNKIIDAENHGNYKINNEDSMNEDLNEGYNYIKETNKENRKRKERRPQKTGKEKKENANKGNRYKENANKGNENKGNRYKGNENKGNGKKENENNKNENKRKQNFNIPMMQERIQSEEEISVYSKTTIGLAFLSILAMGSIIITCIKLDFFQYEIGNKIDITKLFGVLLILVIIEAYLISKLFSKNNKTTIIKETIEYIDNQEEPIMYNRWKDQKKLSNEENSNDIVDTIKEKKTELLHQLDSNKTTLLSICLENTSYQLTSENPEEYRNIPLIEFPFFIGKLVNEVDCSIQSEVISRFHAKIDQKNEEFYITDLNSTNGTYINSERLLSNETKEVHLQDEITFANVKYRLETIFQP